MNREKLLEDFFNGINLDETIRLLSQTDEELRMYNIHEAEAENEFIGEYSENEEEEPYSEESEEEVPFRNYKGIKVEDGFEEEKPSTSTRTTSNRRSSVNRGNPEFEPKTSIVQDNSLLNLDCNNNSPDIIEAWRDNMSLSIAGNPTIAGNNNLAYQYLLHNTYGNVREFLRTIPDNVQTELLRGDSQTVLNNLVRLLYTEFLGRDRAQNQALVTQRDTEKAIVHLTNLQICDMCYFSNYACEYEKYYYKLPVATRPAWNDPFINKLPFEVRQQVQTMWTNRTADVPNTLGGRIEVIKNYIRDTCIARNSEAAIGRAGGLRICCDPEEFEIPSRYGCSRRYPRTSHRRRKHYHKKRYHKRRYYPKYHGRYRKRRHYPKRKQYFRRRRHRRRNYDNDVPRRKGKPATCPTGKSSCKCWLCNEEGHYANACPQRKEKSFNKDKRREIKILEEAYKLNFEPIEDSDISEDESLYLFESESESDFESETESETESENERTTDREYKY